jgi:hypothetical protein
VVRGSDSVGCASEQAAEPDSASTAAADPGDEGVSRPGKGKLGGPQSRFGCRRVANPPIGNPVWQSRMG